MTDFIFLGMDYVECSAIPNRCLILTYLHQIEFIALPSTVNTVKVLY